MFLPQVHCLGRTKVGTSVCFVTMPVFTVRSCQQLALSPSWRTTPCRLSATAYSIHSQLHSILDTVLPSAAGGRAMPWWQGPTYRGWGFTTCTSFIPAWLKSQSTDIRHEEFCSYRHHSNIWIIKIELFPRVLAAIFSVGTSLAW